MKRPATIADKMSYKRSLSSVAIIEGNDDLLIELILIFLPAKSLVRFKLVRKRWCSLISAPSFCCGHNLHHTRRRPDTHPLFIIGGGCHLKYHVCNPAVPGFFPFPLGFEFPFGEILQSCNGLLLLRCRLKEYGKNHYYVFNPTTLQQRDLSPLPFNAVSGIYLMFDPSLSPHYRVVCFQYTKTCTLVHHYDSETHKWKLGAEPITRSLNCHGGIYFNGGIYFLRFGSLSSRFTPDDNLSKIPALPKLPRPLSYWKRQRMIYIPMVSNGVVHLFSKQEGNLVHVYETKEIENGWTKKCQVDFNPILEESEYFELLGMIGGEKAEDSLLLFIVMPGTGKLMSYRFCDSVFEVLLDFSKTECGFETEVYHFIQTLAPV